MVTSPEKRQCRPARVHALEQERERGGTSGLEGGEEKYARSKGSWRMGGRGSTGDRKSSRKQRGKAEIEIGKDRSDRIRRGGADRIGADTEEEGNRKDGKGGCMEE